MRQEDGTARLPPLDAPDAVEQILAAVRRAVGAATDRPWSILIDDASVPLLYGWTPAALLGFLEACEDLVAGGQGMLVVRVPADDDLADEPLGRVVRTLAHRAALRIQFRPLATGYSRDLDGEVRTVHGLAGWREPVGVGGTRGRGGGGGVGKGWGRGRSAQSR